uniref:zinc finger homeobox protein 4 isoform X2 n=1 Tax=Scatophagus argus TaxID=75038 RepID=UPI001ED7FA93|nr:zinc finger homeobox protein 4 isoform X2 [Scatophagus argus]
MSDCAVLGCKPEPGASVHCLPKNPALRQKWMDFINGHRSSRPSNTEAAALCLRADVACQCSLPAIRTVGTQLSERRLVCSRSVGVQTKLPSAGAGVGAAETRPAEQSKGGIVSASQKAPPSPPITWTQPEIEDDDHYVTVEESGETVSSESNGVAEWLCPLCQKGQADRSSLSRHLTEQHSVLPSCVDKLLDIVVLKQAASGGETDKGAQKSADAESSQLKHAEDISSDPCQCSESSDATQTPGDKEMEEERIMEEEGDEAEPEAEGNQLTGAKQQNATENAEIPDSSEPSVSKNGVPAENNTQSFKCNACLETFPSRTALSVHYNSASHIQKMTTGSAKQIGENDPQTPSVPVLSRPYISNKPYQCAICRVSYNHAITLESHMKSVLHQSRSRNAGIAAQAANGAAVAASLGSSTTTAPNDAVTTSASGTTQLVTTTNCAAPGTLMVTTTKDGEQIQTSQVAPSLLTSPVASAQAVSAFLTLLTSSPSTLSHSLLPSLFAAGAASGATVPQLVPQPQMVMPLILNGLQAQTQQHQENQQGQLLTQCVPFVGLSTGQQALLTQRLSSLQNQWPSAGAPVSAQSCLEEQNQAIKCESERNRQDSEETVKEKVSDQVKDITGDNWTTENIKTEKLKEEDSKELAQCPNIESKVKVENSEDNGKAHRDSTTDGDSSTNQLDLEGDKAASLNLSPAGTEKSLRSKNLSPSASVPSNSSLSPVNLNLTLSPDSTPRKSQSGTSPCGSLGTPKSSPITDALTNNQTRSHCNAVGSVQPDLPVLSEFQSEVLWAFFESRSEADAASPPHEDCEALGREVGLSEEEVRRWLSQARHAKQRQRAAEHLQSLVGFTRHGQSSDNDYDDEESSLIIAEGEDETEATGSQAIDLSSTRGKHRQRDLGKEGQGDSCLTSDSENEVYTSVIVSDEESQNGSLREGPESPAKDEAQCEVSGDKGSVGGKVLRSTTVFLSDAEDEYEDEEGGGGQRAKRKKRKGEFERDEVEVKKERQDPDVDLELEAQGDPPSSLSHNMDHPEIPAGALHSLPLSLAPFSTQFLSPYVLSLTPSVIGDGSKVPVFPNPPNITRFSSSLLSQSLSSHNQTSHYLSNGDDYESALDLSMGKNSKSVSSSSSLADKIEVQKGQLLDGLGLRPTSKGLVVVQVKPESVTATPSINSSMSLVNCNNMTKSSIYMRTAEKMNSALLEREREREREKEREQEQQQQQRKSKGKRYRDMRRSRTIIQAEQLDILYGCYFKDPNPGKHEFEQISEWVHLPKKVVQIWFQNMRARERKGEVRFISDGTLAAVGKPLIKFTWPLSKPIFSNKPPSNNTGYIATTPIVRTLMKTEREPVKELGKPTVVKKMTPVPIKPKELVSSTTVSTVSSSASAVPKTKLETTSNITMVKVSPKVNTPVLLTPPKDPVPIAPRPAHKRKLEEESEEEKTDEEKDNENEMDGPGSTNRMVPKLPTTPINNRPPSAAAMPQKQNGLNYWTPKVPIKINTLSREQLALPTHPPARTIPPPPTPSIAPVSPNTPSSAKVASPSSPVVAKSSPTESRFLPHSSSRRPRTHLSCLQLSILQSCYETCAHPNAMECEAIGTELNLPLKVVQIWFQNTRAKEKRWRLQQEKMSPLSGGKVDMSSGSYLQYNALKANRPILPKPVQLTVTEPPASPVPGQPVPKETLTGRCDACNVSFESRAAARAHVFSPRHLATLRTTNFGQPTTLVNKNGTGNGGPGSAVPGPHVPHSAPVTSSGAGSGGERVIDSPPPTATSNS